MKTPNLIVRIPEPCHEDWNKMQPDAKGKFCNSCSKAVVDFSTKTDQEIKQILMEYKDQKVCGHFKKSQVNRPLTIKINFNDLPKNISFSKAFMIAVFLVFGSFLFSCTDHKSGKFDTVEIVDFNKVSSIDGLILVDMQSSPVDSVNAAVEALLQDTLAEESKQQKFSEEVIIPDIYSEEMMTGDMVYVEEYVDGRLIVEEKQSDAIPMDTVNLDEVPIVDYMKPFIDVSVMTGRVSIIESSNCFNHSFNIDSVSVNNDVSTDDLEMTPVKNNFNLFPNPSNGEFTIRYVLQKSSGVSLTINNMNGVLITTFVDMANQYEGKYHIPVNLNELPNGIYLVTLIVNDTKLVKRLVLER